MSRYEKQIKYINIGQDGQSILKNRKICIIGIGALGSVASELLVRAGIGSLLLVDRDYVEITNLQRQSLFDEKDVGRLKVNQAKKKLNIINSQVKITIKSEDLDYSNINDLIGNVDLIFGCTDNMQSRFLINDYAVKYNIPWIYGGAVSDKGIIFNILPKGICLRCIIKGRPTQTCDTLGILNSNSHIVASMMANEGIKILLNKNYEKKLIHINIWKNEFLKINVVKNEKCETCNGNYKFLDGKNSTKAIKLCGTGLYQFKQINMNYNDLKNQFRDANFFSGIFHYKEISVFKDGRVLIRAKDERNAKKLFVKYIGD